MYCLFILSPFVGIFPSFGKNLFFLFINLVIQIILEIEDQYPNGLLFLNYKIKYNNKIIFNKINY